MTDRYAVLGRPIGHSKSPLIHGMFAQACGQDMAYEAIEPSPDGFAEAALAFRDSGGRGINITAPFKLDAFHLATSLSEPARLAGAVNALRFSGDAIEGENFDGVGLVRDIVHNLGVTLTGKRIAVLGAGGAARGALLPLLAQEPASLHIVNRTVGKAVTLADAARSPVVSAGGYAGMGLGGYDVVINATSASLTGDLPAVPARAFRDASLAYELAYGKGMTGFLAMAREWAPGIAQADGVGMLAEQAAEAFAWWRGMRPDTAAVIAAITVPLI